MTQKCSVFSAIGTLNAVTVHPLLWLFIKMLNQSRSRRGCTMNSSPESEMLICACASGLAWLGVCKHLCVCLGVSVEGSLGMSRSRLWSALPHFSPDKTLFPLPLGLWFGACKVPFHNWKPVAPKHSFSRHYFTFRRVRIWPLDRTFLRFPVWFCIHVYIYM